MRFLLALVACLVLFGCNSQKRKKCEAALEKMWGPAAAHDQTYKASFMDHCEQMPDDVIECVVTSAERQRVDPECDAKIKRFRHEKQ